MKPRVTRSGPVYTVLPSFSGTVTIGQTLTGSAGTWEGTGSISYDYEWLSNGVPISGATTTTFVITNDEALTDITFRVTATDDNGSLSATSSGQTVPGVEPNVIATDALDGRILTITIDTLEGVPTPTTELTALTLEGVDVLEDAVGLTYTIPSSASGETVAWTITATNGAGTDTSTGTEVVPADLFAPAITEVPAITGTAQVGETLSAGLAEVTGTPTPVSTVQWERSGTPILGATSLTYTIVEADLGETLTVVHTATNSVGVATAESAATATITEASATPETITSFTITDADTSGDNDLTITVSGATTAYVVAIPNGGSAPSATQIRAGQNAAGTSASVALNFAVSAGSNTETSISIPSGLQGQYDFYATVTDSTVVTSDLNVELDVVGPTLSSATGSAASDTSITWGVTSNEAGGTVYAGARLAAATTALTAAQLVAGTGGDGVSFGNDSTATADANNGGTLTSLTAETGYVVDMVQVDAHGNQSAVVTSGTITTDAAAAGITLVGTVATAATEDVLNTIALPAGSAEGDLIVVVAAVDEESISTDTLDYTWRNDTSGSPSCVMGARYVTASDPGFGITPLRTASVALAVFRGVKASAAVVDGPDGSFAQGDAVDVPAQTPTAAGQLFLALMAVDDDDRTGVAETNVPSPLTYAIAAANGLGNGSNATSAIAYYITPDTTAVDPGIWLTDSGEPADLISVILDKA